MKTIALFFFSFAVACGGNIADIDGGDDSGGADSGNKDVITIDEGIDSGPFSCGKAFCTNDELCIHGCCGGAMICAALDDGGTCPQGLTISQQCPPQEPCTNTCTPPAPYCGTAKDCSMPEGHDCYLLCQ
jgi:hypothetical protein